MPFPVHASVCSINYNYYINVVRVVKNIAVSAWDLAKANADAIKVLHDELIEMKAENTLLKRRADDMEVYSRKDNLIIRGIDEQKNETEQLCVDAVKLFFKVMGSENHTPRFIFLIEALGPISCKNLNKFKKKCPKNLFLANLAILHIPYVTNTPANRCQERLIMFLNAIFKVCKISKTKRRNTY